MAIRMMLRVAVLLCLFTMSATLASSAQVIGSVQLGSTTVYEVRRIRGTPDREGLTVDGLTYFVRYGTYAFYFDADSIARFVRYFPPSLTRSEFEEIFGQALRETRQADLTLKVQYSDTVMVHLDRQGSNVLSVDYHERPNAAVPNATERSQQMVYVRIAALTLVECTRTGDASVAFLDSLRAVQTTARDALAVIAMEVAEYWARDSLFANMGVDSATAQLGETSATPCDVARRILDIQDIN